MDAVLSGDYLKDTGHLSTEEHGAYFLLILDYWSKRGPPPDNDERLARIVRLTEDRWRAIRSTISEFFQIEDGRWQHGRIEDELRKAKEIRLANHERAKNAAAVRWNKVTQKDKAAELGDNDDDPFAADADEADTDDVRF